MNNRPATPPPAAPTLTVSDILYVLFRRKWLILAGSALGVIGAVVVWLVMPRLYQSEAKLFVRYVLETKSPGQISVSDSKITSPDQRGENVINTELEILTSLDLAQEVVTNIGPERILGKAGGSNYYQAAIVVRKNLLTDAPRKSSVIQIVFQHPDPAVVQPVLNQVVEIYLKRHGEIHRSVGMFDDFLTQETDQLRSQLTQTEQELRRAKTNAGIISIDESKKAYSAQIARIRQEILDAEAELVQRQAVAAEMSKLLNAPLPAADTNAPAAVAAPVPPEKIGEYKRVSLLLETLEKKHQELSLLFTSSNSLVRDTQAQITEQEAVKKQLETENPGLLATSIASSARTSIADPTAGARADLLAETARATALQSKIKVLNGQLDSIRREAAAIDDAEGAITALQRKKELQESHYKYFSENLEQARIDEALGASKDSNISKIQAPSPPFRAASKTVKIMAMALFGGVFGSLALAFVFELYLDPTLRRPADIQSKLGLPLFLSIPYMNGKHEARAAEMIRRGRLLSQGDAESGAAADPAVALEPAGDLEGSQIVSLGAKFRVFHEALRDRLITWFEVKNLTHNPKLVAVTSCGEGSGVSTVAAGLAATLSETGEGNVLLVDMNNQGVAHQFHRGKPACGLDDALELSKREGALVQQNLYVVTEGKGDQLPRVMPRRFNHLLPRLKASDYDYIIFDLPPVSQISFTPRLSRFMDIVLMVAESEKTNRDVLKKACTLLGENNPNIGVVVNKTQTHVPKRLSHEL